MKQNGGMRRALVIGAGRMGLTHIALFNLLTEFGIRWTIVEPSLLVRMGLRSALPKSQLDGCFASIDKRWERFDFGLITSPTTTHAAAYADVASIADKVFVEKPLAVAAPTPATMCGYVMLHHPLHTKMKELIGDRELRHLEIELRANTVLAPSNGWRNLLAKGGGVVNEFGSHLLSLLIDLAGRIAEITIEESIVCHSVDAPDIAVLSGVAIGGTTFKIRLDWTDATVRKPTYCIRADFNDETALQNDFYELVNAEKRISIADFETGCGSYLRGIEFTNQARHFLEHSQFTEQLAVAIEVDRILEKLRDRSR